MNYSSQKLEVYKTEEFDRWFYKLKDRTAKARMHARLDRMALGHFGDVEPVGEGVSELRFFYGPGYRIYFTMRSPGVVVILMGGDKSSQSKDVHTALELARQVEM